MNDHTNDLKLGEQIGVNALVGQALAIWSNMETNLVLLCAGLLNADRAKTGLVLYSIASFNTWLAIIGELISHDSKFNTHNDTWKKLANTLRGLHDTRVRLAHHGRDFSLDRLVIKPAPLDIRTKTKKAALLTPKEIGHFSGRAMDMGEQLYALAVKIDPSLQALLERGIQLINDQCSSNSQ